MKQGVQTNGWTLLYQPGCLIDDPETMGEIFVSSFASVFTSATPANPFPQQVCDGTPSQIGMTFECVHFALRDLESNSGMGPDKIHPHVLKAWTDELLTHCR